MAYGLGMDSRLQAISDSVHDINKNLFLLQGDVFAHSNILEAAVKSINEFEAEAIHLVRQAMEGKWAGK